MSDLIWVTQFEPVLSQTGQSVNPLELEEPSNSKVCRFSNVDTERASVTHSISDTVGQITTLGLRRKMDTI